MLVRVITYTFTDPRIPGAGEQVYRLVTTIGIKLGGSDKQGLLLAS
jgi:hypothetical protein